LTVLGGVLASIVAVLVALDRWRCWLHQLAAESTTSGVPTGDPGDDRDLTALSTATADVASPAALRGGQLMHHHIESAWDADAGAPSYDTVLADPAAPPSHHLAPLAGPTTKSDTQGVSSGRWLPGLTAAAAVVLAVGSLLVIGSRPAALAYVYLGAVLVPLLVCDVRHHRLPTCFIAPAYPVLAVSLGLDAAVMGQWARLGTAALGGLILGGVYLVLCVLPGRLMGLGDVRLAGVLGAALAWLGWDSLLLGALGAFALSFLAALPQLLLRRTRLQSRVAFGPYMLAAAALAVAVAA